MDLPSFVYPFLLKALTDLEAEVTSYYKPDGKRKKLLNCIIRGTVFSGHPSRTTLGNTMRVALYFLFILHKAKIDHFSLHVAGDDTFLLIE
jgi:hypothetical protein